MTALAPATAGWMQHAAGRSHGAAAREALAITFVDAGARLARGAALPFSAENDSRKMAARVRRTIIRKGRRWHARGAARSAAAAAAACPPVGQGLDQSLD